MSELSSVNENPDFLM